MEEHLSRVESLLIQVELELYEIKSQLKLPASQEHILRHLKEKREAALARYQRCHMDNLGVHLRHFYLGSRVTDAV